MRCVGLVLALCAGVAMADDPVQQVLVPEDMSKWLGDPNRGPEPDPAQHKGRWDPPLDPVVCNQGHPVRDYGLFRMKAKVCRTLSLPQADCSLDTQKAARDRFELASWKDGTLLKYAILRPPADVAKPKEGWPVVFSCPGVGEIGREEMEVRKGIPHQAVLWGLPYYREHFPCYVVHFLPKGRTVNYEGPEKKDGPGTTRTTPVLDAYLDVMDDLLVKEPINKTRVYVLGFSMGGSSIWQMLARRPDFFAAAAPAAGSPIQYGDDVSALKHTPIWMFMGNKDPWSGSMSYIEMYQRLNKAGANRVRFWEIQDMTHSPEPLLMVPVAEWLFAQRHP